MNWQDIEGWFSVRDAEFVRNVCANIHNGIVVELGCYAGKSTAVMAPICNTNNNTYHAVDNFHGSDPKDPATRNQRSRDIQQVFQANMDKLQLLNYIHLHKMDSAESASLFDDDSVDFCFVDASMYQKMCNEILMRGGLRSKTVVSLVDMTISGLESDKLLTISSKPTD